MGRAADRRKEAPESLRDRRLTVQHLRFILLDDIGPIRRVQTRDEAEALQNMRPEWRLIVEPKQPRPVIDLAAIEGAPF